MKSEVLVTQSCPTLCECHGLSLSMEFSRQEYCSGLLFPSPEYCPNPGIEQRLLHILHWQADSLPLSHLGSHGGSQWEHYSCNYSHQQHPFRASWQEDDQKEGLPLPLWREILRRAYPERQELCFWLGVHRSQWQVTHTSMCSPCLMHPPPHQPPCILSYTREHVCVLVHTHTHTHTHLLPQAKHAPGTWTSPGPNGAQPSTPAIARDPGQ